MNISSKSLLITRWLFLAVVFAFSAIGISAQFVEGFGNAGTVRRLQGQIRDGLDAPIPLADITVSTASGQQILDLNANEKGVFQKDLPPGEYKIRVHASGFNLAEYTVKIARAGSRMFIVTRLSPGCASGNSGVALVRRLKDPSFKYDN